MSPFRVLLVAPTYQSKLAPRQLLDVEVLLGYLRRAGFPVQVVDAQRSALPPEALAGTVRAHEAALVYWHLASRRELKALHSAVPGLPSGPGAPLMVAGGIFATRHDLEILAAVPRLDAVVRGEPEVPLEGLAGRLAQGGDWCTAPGLSLRGGDGQGMRNPAAPLLEDLAALPMATDDLFEQGRLAQGQQVLLSRGCNSNCSYCGLQVPYREGHPGRVAFWRGRPASAVVDEMEHYYHARGVRKFSLNSFVTFGHDERGSRQLAKLAEELLRRKLEVGFSFITHPHHLRRNRELLPLLKQAGLQSVVLGMDTGLERAFSLYRLEFTREDTREALRALHAHHIDFLPSFIFYDPYLTLAELRDNLRFLAELEPWFGNMKAPYAYFLDQHLLSSVLQVHVDMPIQQTLREDGLCEAVAPLEKDPAIRFRSPETGQVFKLHQQANKTFVRTLRALMFSLPVCERFPWLGRFPLELMERMVSLAGEAGYDEQRAGESLLEWTRGRVSPHLEEMLDVLQLPAKEREPFAVLK